MGTQSVVHVPGTGELLAIRSGDAGSQVQHSVGIGDGLRTYLASKVEFGRRGRGNVMTDVTQHWDGHPPENLQIPPVTRMRMRRMISLTSASRAKDRPLAGP